MVPVLGWVVQWGRSCCCWASISTCVAFFCGSNRRIVQSVAAMRMTKTKTTRTTYSSDHGTTADWTCFQPSPPIFRRGNPSRTRATSRQIPAHATKISPRLRFFFFHLPLWLFGFIKGLFYISFIVCLRILTWLFCISGSAYYFPTSISLHQHSADIIKCL